MPTRSRRLALALILVPVLASGLAACGKTTIDPKSGEDIIRSAVKAAGVLTVKSVSCPSNVVPKDGNKMVCKVTVSDRNKHQESGTITLHVVANAKKLELNPATDVKLA